MFSKLSVAAVFVFSAACGGLAVAQTVEQFPSPSGVTVSFVKCGGKSSKCMKKAAAFCKGSYQVIGSESHAGGLIADILPGPVPWYSITFLCGKSDGAMPQFPFVGPRFVMPTIVIPQSVQTSCTTIGNTVNCYSH